jgi:hypothetical protein
MVKKFSIPSSFFPVAVVALLAYGCLPAFVEPRPGATTATSTTGAVSGGAGSVAAFKATVYPLVTAHCAQCHTGTNQPFFAGSDAQSDHDALVQNGKVDLANPANSRLVQRLGQDMHNCWGDCASNAATMKAAIALWASMMQSSTTSSGSTSTNTSTTTTPAVRMNTIEVTVPSTIPGPGGTAFATMSWTLASAADTITPDIPGATFMLDIQKFDQYSYLVRNPRIASPSTAVYVADIRISVNGVIRSNDTTFSLVNLISPMGTTATSLSPASMVMLMDKGAGTDQFSISFAKVMASAAGGCKNLAGWQSAVKPVMQATCVRCHNAGNSFDMANGTDAQICGRTLGRIDTSFPSNSILVTYPLTGTNHAGGGGLINQTTANSWVNWITSER